MSKFGDQPAFPLPDSFIPNSGVTAFQGHGGMTYRQWMVGQALIGLLARHWPGEGADFAPSFRNSQHNEEDAAHFGNLAVMAADAAIAAQEKQAP